MKPTTESNSVNILSSKGDLLDGIKETEVDNIINEVADLLSDDNHLAVDHSIEKQILAFSRSELLKTDSSYIKESVELSELNFAGTLNPNQWWRRFSLPSFVVGGFVLTVFAFNSLWQPLFNNQQNHSDYKVNTETNEKIKIKQPQVELTLNGEEAMQVASSISASRLMREKNKQQIVAEFDENNKRPNLDIRLTDKKNIEFSNINTKQVPKGFINPSYLVDDSGVKVKPAPSNLQSQNIYTGTELVKSAYPEKEAWVKKIYELFKNSKKEQAMKELKAFKQQYPNYPIDEQLTEYLQ